MKKLLVIFLFVFLASNPFFAQTTFNIEIKKSSSITINGTTNLLSFRLSQDGEKLKKRNFVITANQNKDKIILSQNENSIIVKDFTSNNKMAKRDFLKLVKADIFPTINFQLNYFEIDKNFNKPDLSHANVSINLIITGKSTNYDILVKSKHEGDIYTLDGSKKINIRDFGLTPPVEMLGLIHVNEWIEINFHIICIISSKSPH